AKGAPHAEPDRGRDEGHRLLDRADPHGHRQLPGLPVGGLRGQSPRSPARDRRTRLLPALLLHFVSTDLYVVEKLGLRRLMDYFDRNGEPIDAQDWGNRGADNNYRRVAEDYVDSYRVSTVWLGLDHGSGQGPPRIFETMVFGEDKPGWDLYCKRYS